jgi:hypothetical protein
VPQREAFDSGDRLADMLDLLAALIAVSLMTLVLADRYGLPRILVSVGFAAFVPGRAIVSNWPRVGAWSQVTMSFVFSLAFVTLVATVTLWAHAWDPVRTFEAEALLSVVALAVGVLRRGRRHIAASDRSRSASRPPGHRQGADL